MLEHHGVAGVDFGIAGFGEHDGARCVVPQHIVAIGLLGPFSKGVRHMMKPENPQAGELSAEKRKMMAQLGITHFFIDNFHYREYRYTNFEDAIAQARRDLGK